MARFTEYEDQYLRDHYHTLGGSHCSEHLGRSVRQIWKRATKLGLSRPTEPVETQKQRIAERYGAPFLGVCQRFADAGWSCAATAREFEMKRDTLRVETKGRVQFSGRHKSWSTHEQDQYIVANYQAKGGPACAKVLGWTTKQVNARARQLGVAGKAVPVHKRKLAIAEEYGMPFIEVVRLYAQAGHSRLDTARILGWNEGSLRRETEGLVEWPDYIEAGRRVMRERGNHKRPNAGINGARANEKLLTVNGVTANFAEHCRRVGLYQSTVKRRLKAGYSLERSLDPTPLRRKMPKPGASHYWRSLEQKRLENIKAKQERNGARAAEG